MVLDLQKYCLSPEGNTAMAWFGDLVTAATIVLLILAARRDLATRIIPDGISITLVGLGIASRSLAGLPNLALSVGLAAGLFILLVPAHARGVLGGGDVKLLAATAVGLSPESLYGFVVVTALAGGALALLHLTLRRAFRGVSTAPPPRGIALSRRIAAAERWRIARHGSLPYGVAIACGGIWAVVTSRGG
jgi:prepilin peptidase CpaA